MKYRCCENCKKWDSKITPYDTNRFGWCDKFGYTEYRDVCMDYDGEHTETNTTGTLWMIERISNE